jgi:glutathione synthase/RimK-type ligase-like ATP-grasp enzyme
VILLWGLSGDDPLDDIGAELRRAGHAVTCMDQRDVLDTTVELEPCGTRGSVAIAGSRIALADVRALFIRNYEARRLEAVVRGGASAADRVETVESAMWCFADLAPIRVLNRPSAMVSNNSKPYQSQLVRAHGFAVPETLVTTDAEAAMAFWRRHRAVIYKSVSGQRSIVRQLSSAHLDRLDDLQWCPTQLQAYVAGRDYRVHVIGTKLFATEVVSGADDYRYASRQGSDVQLRACELPPEIGERCLAVSAALELPLAGIDLRRSIDGDWVCFEVNPSPCFTYYEHHSGQPMTHAVAELLASHQ